LWYILLDNERHGEIYKTKQEYDPAE